jgi:8-oxo-dGTP diphosphatase
LQTKQVVTCFLESQNRILILRRSHKVGTYQGKWAAVSGYIEKTPDEQAIIEIHEETGLESADISLVSRGNPLEVTDEKLQVKWIVHPFLFMVINPDKIQLDWEHQEFKWISASDIIEYETVPMLKEALDGVKNERDSY